MASNAPFGFSPVITNGKEPPLNVYAPSGYCIASGYSTGIRFGDLVKLSGTANLAADSTAQYIVGTRPDIVKSAAGDVHTGVFAGVAWTDATTKERKFSKFWAASTTGKDIVAYVYDHENTVFSAQYAGVTGTNPFTASDVGLSKTATIGSTSTQISDSVISVTTPNESSAFGDVLILGATDTADNAVIADYARLNVIIRLHRMRGAAAATGLPVSQ
jgi:hypothetical protein